MENKHGNYKDLARAGEQESEMSVKRNCTDKGQERVQWVQLSHPLTLLISVN